MTTIKIYEHGDTLYFLDSNGFQKGIVKRTQVTSETGDVGPTIKYWLRTATDYREYQGLERGPDQVFETYEEMINHYSAAKI